MAENGLKMEGNEDDGCKNNQVFISVKEEPFMFVDGDENGFDEVPKPVEGLREYGPPAFLKKTFEMVDNPQTDTIISWSSTRASFVVWDPHKFSTDLLPKHFKHNNFSSFVRQLNTYRFRKIDSDRWEFANEGFQQGKKHLLKHIKRRKQNSQFIHQQGPSQSWLNSTVEAELEKLKSDHKTLRSQVLKLKQQQENTLDHLAAIKERLHITEMKQKNTVIFVIKSLKNPWYLQHFVEEVKRKRALSSGRILKKRRLVDSMSTIDTGESIDDKGLTILSEIQGFSCDESGSTDTTSEMNSVDVSSENFVLWEKLMEDDMIYEEDQEASIKQQHDIVFELENLISKATGDRAEPLGCPASTA